MYGINCVICRAYAFASFVIGTSFEFSPSSAARLRHLIVLGRDIADLSARLTDDELLGSARHFRSPDRVRRARRFFGVCAILPKTGFGSAAASAGYAIAREGNSAPEKSERPIASFGFSHNEFPGICKIQI
jgi:hypothetical protein